MSKCDKVWFCKAMPSKYGIGASDKGWVLFESLLD